MVEEPELYRFPTALLLADGSKVDGELLTWDWDPNDPDLCRVNLHFAGRELSASGEKDWDALLSIREQLEHEGLRVLCYGSSLHVYPSGMSYSMGSGGSAYKLKLGQRTSMADAISIFNSGPDVIPATVEEQSAFYKTWLESVRPGA